jgi:hypothetical protein
MRLLQDEPFLFIEIIKTHSQCEANVKNIQVHIKTNIKVELYSIPLDTKNIVLIAEILKITY